MKLFLLAASVIMVASCASPAPPAVVEATREAPPPAVDPGPAYAAIDAYLSTSTTTTTSTTSTTVARPATIRTASVGAPAVAGDPPDSDFDRLASCESGGRWDLNTGNGYFGGLQFSASTWHANGGAGLPHERSREEQIEVARRTWRARGWSPWPWCSRHVGLR